MRIDSPSETKAGSRLFGSDEAAKIMVPPDLAPPWPPVLFSPPPQAASTSANAATRARTRGIGRTGTAGSHLRSLGPSAVAEPPVTGPASYQSAALRHTRRLRPTATDRAGRRRAAGTHRC